MPGVTAQYIDGAGIPIITALDAVAIAGFPNINDAIPAKFGAVAICIRRTTDGTAAIVRNTGNHFHSFTLRVTSRSTAVKAV